MSGGQGASRPDESHDRDYTHRVYMLFISGVLPAGAP